jgi:hypothetical protein
VLISQQLVAHSVSRTQLKVLRFLIVDVNPTGLGPASWVASVTMVLSTVSRSRVELTALLISPSARSSPTDCASALVRISTLFSRSA